ncbi:MAG: OprO/OprP family phosphate-selective porin [Methylophilaceae bacterium]|nr:OprO/OprP family phosphate-selective porin [Methylophilaceae bacterium]
MSISPAWAGGPSIEQQIEVLMQEIEALKAQLAKTNSGNQSNGIQNLAERTTLGGYGELHYNDFRGEVPAGKTLKKDEVDFHRFVLFFGHRFNDWISLKAELEVEHALTKGGGSGGNGGGGGEVELEQAYLDFNFNKHVNLKTGVFLLPLGILNETHEPPTFYGVERNIVESRIIPSTWWEAGVALYGEITPGLHYQAGLTSSLDAGKFKADFSNGVRDGRRKVNEAVAENIAFSGALNYSGIPGLLVGAAVFTGETGQDGKSDADLAGTEARLTLWDVHLRYQKDRLDLRALYAQGHLDDAAEIKAATGINAAERFYGWYAEAAYHVWKQGDHDIAPFVRYEKWDTHARVPSNVTRLSSNRNNVWTIGVNYQPHPQVVLKGDYQRYDKPDGDKGDRSLNLGMGYMF